MNADVEPGGWLWRPARSARRWQYRMRLEGRTYPAGSQFIPLFMVVEPSEVEKVDSDVYYHESMPLRPMFVMGHDGEIRRA